jgi:hypothetical protein
VEIIQGNYRLAGDLCSQALAAHQELRTKSGIAVDCAAGGVVMAALGCLRLAEIVYHGSLAAAVELGLEFENNDRQLIDSMLACFDAAVAAGEISTEELAERKAQGEAMSLDELAEFTLAALAEATEDDGTGQICC